jgi:hypothetical protein
VPRFKNAKTDGKKSERKRITSLFRRLPDDREADAEFDEIFGGWLEKSVGIPRSLFASLDTDDDWTFVIKMHGVLEAGLNHLLLTRLFSSENPDKLSRLVAQLDTSDPRKGKLAFIKAYDLLPPDNLFVYTTSLRGSK